MVITKREGIYCPLFKKDIGDGKCIDICYELSETKKEEYVKDIRKFQKLTNDEIINVCESCPNYPFEYPIR